MDFLLIFTWGGCLMFMWVHGRYVASTVLLVPRPFGGHWPHQWTAHWRNHFRQFGGRCRKAVLRVWVAVWTCKSMEGMVATTWIKWNELVTQLVGCCCLAWHCSFWSESASALNYKICSITASSMAKLVSWVVMLCIHAELYHLVPSFHRRAHRGSKGSHKHSGDSQRDGSSAPPAKVARADAVSPPKSSTNGSSRTVHTLPAEEQADSIEDENFQVSFSTGCLLTVDVCCTRVLLRQHLELGKCKFCIIFFPPGCCMMSSFCHTEIRILKVQVNVLFSERRVSQMEFQKKSLMVSPKITTDRKE